MLLSKNKIISLTILELNNEGFGKAYYNELPIIISHVLPGEKVKVKIIEVFAKYAIAKLEEIVEPSPLRIEPPCEFFSKCGGCNLQHLADYFEFKTSVLKRSLQELGFLGVLHPVIQVNQNTRRRAVFKINNNKLSFHQHRSDQTVRISHCLLLEKQINKLILPINTLLCKLKNNIKKLSIMSSDTGIELLFHSDTKNNLEEDVALANFAALYDVARIAWQIQLNQPFSIIQRKPMQLVFDNARVDLPINSFLQASKESAKAMTEIIMKHLDSVKTLELYCGCGSFSIPMSAKAEIFAIEGNEDSIKVLELAAKSYNLPIKAIKQDLYQNPVLSNFINNYSQVVINPPRNGATPQIKQIAQSLSVKKVILVSCSLNNFIRDSKIMLEKGFKLKEIYPIDQFLYSAHIEIIGIFQKI